MEKNHKGKLQEYCQKHRINMPIYKELYVECPDHARKFKSSVILSDPNSDKYLWPNGEKEYTGMIENTKKAAEASAARIALINLDFEQNPGQVYNIDLTKPDRIFIIDNPNQEINISNDVQVHLITHLPLRDRENLKVHHLCTNDSKLAYMAFLAAENMDKCDELIIVSNDDKIDIIKRCLEERGIDHQIIPYLSQLKL